MGDFIGTVGGCFLGVFGGLLKFFGFFFNFSRFYCNFLGILLESGVFHGFIEFLGVLRAFYWNLGGI